MGWIIFIGYLILGFFLNITSGEVDELKKELKEAKENNEGEDTISFIERNLKITSVFFNIWVGIALTGFSLLILYAIGWVWYYFCSGFLVFEDQPFWDKVVCGFISLIPLGFVVGGIAIFFGWDPWRK